eukprot:TRINITY_DN14295_c0_g1_i9.p1 TRINITY_DN14295_c0_g1~~TRINITY_DN14295_c0_g1_i9.p1  ORF type:complete len:282 (-),score=34.71 TRINITY_DN14295_c0_g1_i9:396-1241(-)
MKTILFLGLLTTVNAVLKVGLFQFFPDTLPYFLNFTAEGCAPSFECDILTTICDTLGEDCEIVPLLDLDDRFQAVFDGTVDMSISLSHVNPERAELVHFVRPYYYYSGATIFDLASIPEDEDPTWADIEGKKVCIAANFYAIEAIKFAFKADVVEVDPEQFITTNMTFTGLVMDGVCDYIVSASTQVIPGMRQSTKALIEFGAPYGVAVSHEARDTLGEEISKILLSLMNKGEDSAIFELEKKYLNSVGLASNIKLADIVRAITDFDGTLPAAVEDAIWDE